MSLFIRYKPEKQQLMALARCKSPENKALIDLFETALQDVLEALVVADDQTTINRLQGKASVLKNSSLRLKNRKGCWSVIDAFFVLANHYVDRTPNGA